MLVERMRAAIASAWTFAQADELARGIYRAMADETLTEQDERDLHGLLETLQARRAEIRARAGSKRAAGADEPRRRSIFPERVYQPIADLPASRKRARQLATSGPLPPELAASFTISHLAALRIVADEVARTGTCRLHVEAIAARAGISRRSVQYALRAAEAEGLLIAKERPRKGEPHMTNLIHVTNPEWAAWIEKGKRPGPNGKAANFTHAVQDFAPHGQGSNPEPLAPRPARRAAEGERADSQRAAATGSAWAEAERGEGGAMSEGHAVVRHSERPAIDREVPMEARWLGHQPGRGGIEAAAPGLPLGLDGGREWHALHPPTIAQRPQRGPGAGPHPVAVWRGRSGPRAR